MSPKGGTVSKQNLTLLADITSILAAINIPDNPMCTVRACSVAYAKIVKDFLRIDVIPHLSCRDRNSLALQSHILGANLFGIKNLLLLSGDKSSVNTECANSSQLDSLGLCKLVKNLNNGTAQQNGKLVKLEGRTDFLIGGVIIFDRKLETTLISRKIDCGFNFFQSQIIFNSDVVLDFFSQAEDQGLLLNKPILIGFSPQQSRKSLNRVLNFLKIGLPNQTKNRLDRTSEFGEELNMILLEIADDLKSALSKYKIGFHIMPLGNDLLGKKLVNELRA